MVFVDVPKIDLFAFPKAFVLPENKLVPDVPLLPNRPPLVPLVPNPPNPPTVGSSDSILKLSALLLVQIWSI